MKKIFLTLLLLSGSKTLFTMDARVARITLAGPEELNKRLTDLNLKHFAETTQIDRMLGNRTTFLPLMAMKVDMTVELAIHKYNRDHRNNNTSTPLEIHKSTIIKTILKDHPEAIAFLKEKGYFNYSAL